MNWNTTTFILQIFNFLVFVWLLKRFLYKPVLNFIKQRKEVVSSMWNEAQKAKEAAEKLKADYENRLKLWEEEKKKAKEELQEELRIQRAQLIAENQKALELENERNRVLEEKRKLDMQMEAERRALQIGAKFVAHFLSTLASEAVEKKLIELCLDRLRSLPEQTLELIQQTIQREEIHSVCVKSAYPVEEATKRKLKELLEQLAKTELSFEFVQDQKIMAGIRIIIGSWIARASIEDELEFFLQEENR